jgi:hypothetical protein
VGLDNWLSLTTGVVCLGAGVALIRYRAAVANFFAQFYRTMNSPIGERAARSSKSSTMMFVGVVWVCGAVGEIMEGIFRHNWS